MYKIKHTALFLKDLKTFRKNKQVLTELDKKIKRLREDPHIVGGHLSGNLHGRKSTRLAKKVRLIFRIDEDIVYLETIDHRGTAYE